MRGSLPGVETGLLGRRLLARHRCALLASFFFEGHQRKDALLSPMLACLALLLVLDGRVFVSAAIDFPDQAVIVHTRMLPASLGEILLVERRQSQFCWVTAGSEAFVDIYAIGLILLLVWGRYLASLLLGLEQYFLLKNLLMLSNLNMLRVRYLIADVVVVHLLVYGSAH